MLKCIASRTLCYLLYKTPFEMLFAGIGSRAPSDSRLFPVKQDGLCLDAMIDLLSALSRLVAQADWRNLEH